jgi:hypothetical protein
MNTWGALVITKAIVHLDLAHDLISKSEQSKKFPNRYALSTHEQDD